MSAYTPRYKKTADGTDIERQLPSDAVKLGIDRIGATHYYSQITHEIVVVSTADTVERRQNLNERSIETWIDYVADERGWSRLNYADSFTDVLADALEVA